MINWYKIATTKELYHVTLTSHIPSIQQKGIMPMGGPSNWEKASGGRYGIGDVHALQSLTDAVKWAAHWDWELSTSFGSGKISIIKFKYDDQPWETDESDPLSQLNYENPWLKRMNTIPKENIIEIIPLTKELVKNTLSKR